MVTLLVGARYGVSQVVNHKLSILSTLTEFSSITRIELLPEADKVSLVKLYLQDIKVGMRTHSLLASLWRSYSARFPDPVTQLWSWTVQHHLFIFIQNSLLPSLMLHYEGPNHCKTFL